MRTVASGGVTSTSAREPASPDLTGNRFGTGLDLFGAFSDLVGGWFD